MAHKKRRSSERRHDGRRYLSSAVSSTSGARAQELEIRRDDSKNRSISHFDWVNVPVTEVGMPQRSSVFQSQSTMRNELLTSLVKDTFGLCVGLFCMFIAVMALVILSLSHYSLTKECESRALANLLGPVAYNCPWPLLNFSLRIVNCVVLCVIVMYFTVFFYKWTKFQEKALRIVVFTTRMTVLAMLPMVAGFFLDLFRLVQGIALCEHEMDPILDSRGNIQTLQFSLHKTHPGECRSSDSTLIMVPVLDLVLILAAVGTFVVARAKFDYVYGREQKKVIEKEESEMRKMEAAERRIELESSLRGRGDRGSVSSLCRISEDILDEAGDDSSSSHLKDDVRGYKPVTPTPMLTTPVPTEETRAVSPPFAELLKAVKTKGQDSDELHTDAVTHLLSVSPEHSLELGTITAPPSKNSFSSSG